MRSYGGYRALVVLATLLAHMTGTTFAGRNTNKQANNRSGKSSSSLWFCLSFSFHLVLSLLAHVLLRVLLFAMTDPFHLHPRSRAARCASFASLAIYFFFSFVRRAVESITYLDSFFYTLLSLRHYMCPLLYFMRLILLFSFFSLSLLNGCSIFSYPFCIQLLSIFRD